MEKHYQSLFTSKKTDIAIGYYQDRLDRVPVYLKTTGGDTVFADTQYYESDKHKNLAGNLGFFYEYNYKNHFVIGTENRAFQSSSDYQEVISKIYIKKTF